jgi:hypothetical protein
VATELKDFKKTDLLIVSREPSMHSLLLRKKDRVVIQDFYMASPKHPFLKWFLDDRMEKFNKGDRQKGPFSYSIENDIDRFRALKIKEMSTQVDISELIDGNFFATAGDIFELPEGVLHPLIDSTNSRCSHNGENIFKSVMTPALIQLCFCSAGSDQPVRPRRIRVNT